MTELQSRGPTGCVLVDAARREAAMALARLAEVCVTFADTRAAECRAAAEPGSGPGRARPGEFTADELSVVLREQPYAVRCLIARTRRLAAGLPTVWEAFRRGDLDGEQVRVIDRVARRVAERSTLTAIDESVVDAAQSRSPKQLRSWLLRLVVQLEPLAFAARHRRALAERKVSVVQGADGIGYVTGEVSATDAAAIDALLAAAARDLGSDDPRTDQQRRSDLFADLLLGRLRLDDGSDEDDPAEDAPDDEPATDTTSADVPTEDAVADWVEVEDIDPDTGELLRTRLVLVDGDGEPLDEPADVGGPPTNGTFAFVRRPRTLRIGVVVPLSSLLGTSDACAELADRSGVVPGEVLRQQIADALGSTSGDEVLFTRLLTDDGGRLLDVTELGRRPSARLAGAVKIRAGTCRFPTCSVPADRCDLDHHDPWPHGATSGHNLDPGCRRHHRGKTFAWLASRRDDDAVEWTLPEDRTYRCIDEPLPVGLAA